MQLGGAFRLVGEDLLQLGLAHDARVSAETEAVASRLDASGGDDGDAMPDLLGGRSAVDGAQDGSKIADAAAVLGDLGAQMDVDVLMGHHAVDQISLQPLRVVALGDVEDMVEIAA